MEFSLLDTSFHLYHDIRRDGVHFMGSFCVFCNFFHQLSFGGSRDLNSTVLTKTYKGGHFFHHCVIILCLFMFFYKSRYLRIICCGMKGSIKRLHEAFEQGIVEGRVKKIKKMPKITSSFF